MNQFAAFSASKRLLGEIPAGWWLPVVQKTASNDGVAKATGLRPVEVEALFILAGLLAMNKNLGLCVKKKRWGLVESGSYGQLAFQTRQGTSYVCRGPPLFPSALQHKKAQLGQTYTPSSLSPAVTDLVYAVSTKYNGRQAVEQQERQAEEQRERQAAIEAAATKAAT